MTLEDRYYDDVKRGIIEEHPAQVEMVAVLQTLSAAINKKYHARFSWLPFKRKIPLLGWYCWGGVGIGKTYLMDLFFDSLETPRKMRLHFHAFMRTIHQGLKQHQGHLSPLEWIATDLAKSVDVLCFDEFMVHDIADAMILGELLKALFTRGVILLATSNSAPDDLYRNGLQRNRFLPAILEIKKHCQVHHMNLGIDFRMRTLHQSGVYLSPITLESQKKMHDYFLTLTSFRGHLGGEIAILQRIIRTRGVGAEVVWFDFQDICGLGRSQQDYLEIAKMYHTVLISGLRPIGKEEKDLATYFIFLVDVFYDAKLKLIVEASVAVDDLYGEGDFSAAFLRTKSRLHEMQSDQYLHARVLL